MMASQYMILSANFRIFASRKTFLISSNKKFCPPLIWILMIVLVGTWIETTNAYNFSLIIVKQITLSRDRTPLSSDAACGFKIDADMAICKAAATDDAVSIPFDENGIDGGCGVYDVFYQADDHEKPDTMIPTARYNMVQCPGASQPFYLKKIKQIKKNKNHKDDGYEVYSEETDFPRVTSYQVYEGSTSY